ncbi:acyl-CoA dehydrogenase family protein [Streptomyces sp. KL116D]|uniref:acyl-CoA dehydrogenase family protein n=1 Tax=Streptomyces sp. KL116D TaxID=3045152 RepID=UPI003558C82E
MIDRLEGVVVDFGLTDEQEMLRATARDFVRDVRPAEKAKEWDEQGIVPAGLFEGMADMGWFSPPFSECGGWGRWRAA